MLTLDLSAVGTHEKLSCLAGGYKGAGEGGLTLASGSSWSAVTIAGLSRLPWDIGPVVVYARGSMTGRKELEPAVAGVRVPLAAAIGLGGSSLGDARTSLPFSKSAPPSVAHFRMVWMR